MNTTKGSEPKSVFPKRDLNQSEWDVAEGNNRIYQMRRSYERSLRKLTENQPAETIKICKDFLKRTSFEGISIGRQMNYILTLRKLIEVMGETPLKEVGEEHVSAFLDGISRFSPGTVRIRFYCLRKFLKFIGKPELVDGIRPPSEGDIKVRAGDLLTREDIARMIDACCTDRARAFVMSLYESGARIGELLNVELKDLDFDVNGVLVEINGKTGRRRIRLVESAPYLRKWVNELKESHPKTFYLWFGVNENEPSQYAATVKFLRKTARLAGIKKRIYPHLFRHSRASELAQKLKESQLRAFMGWGAASDMPRVYIHLSAQDVDKAILDIYRKETPKEDGSLDEIRDLYMFWKKIKARS